MRNARSTPGARNCVHILGVPIDIVTMEDAIAAMEAFVAEGTPHLVVTADASGIAQSQEDTGLRELYDTADLVTPDSQGVLWAARRKGINLAERVSGVEMVDRVCGLSASKGYRIYFLGAAPGVAADAAERMRAKYPGCQIVGARDGFFKPEQDADVAEEVAKSDPDFLFVGMGIPRQEKFIRATEHIIKARVAMGVGGSFDVFSGRVKRAPKLFQRLKMEWLWRLAQNPKKIGKVMMLPKFVSYVIKEKA